MATKSEKISKFIVFAAEAVGGVLALEATHTSDPALDAAVVLLEAVGQVGARAVPDNLAQYAADRPRVGAMPVRRHLLRSEAHGYPSRAEERLGRLHVAVLAEHGVDQVAVPVDRPIQVRPAAKDLQVVLVDMPTRAGAASRYPPGDCRLAGLT